MFVWRKVSTCWNSCTWVVGACVKLASWAAVVSESTGDAGSGQAVGSPQYNQTGRLRRGDRYLFVDASRSPRWGQFLSEVVLLLFHNSRNPKEELNPFFGWGILTSSLLRGLCTQNYRITSPLILLPQTELNSVKHSEYVYSIYICATFRWFWTLTKTLRRQDSVCRSYIYLFFSLKKRKLVLFVIMLVVILSKLKWELEEKSPFGKKNNNNSKGRIESAVYTKYIAR